MAEIAGKASLGSPRKSAMWTPKSYQRMRIVLRRVYAVRWRLRPPDFSRTYRVRLNGLRLTVLPQVFHPAWHFTSEFLAKSCSRLPGIKGAEVLDLGTGTGIVALSAARVAAHVTAVDINPAAVRCATQNAIANGLDGKVEALEGDMYGPVSSRLFDLVLCNPPYFRGTPKSEIERAYYGGENLEWLTRMARETHDHLRPGGKLICVFGDAADVETLVATIEREGWIGQVHSLKQLWTEELSIWEFTPMQRGNQAHDTLV